MWGFLISFVSPLVNVRTDWSLLCTCDRPNLKHGQRQTDLENLVELEHFHYRHHAVCQTGTPISLGFPAGGAHPNLVWWFHLAFSFAEHSGIGEYRTRKCPNTHSIVVQTYKYLWGRVTIPSSKVWVWTLSANGRDGHGWLARVTAKPPQITFISSSINQQKKEPRIY